MNKKVGFISLGCAKNRVDSEKIMGMLVTGGLSLTDDPDQADYIIINTCGFIKSAKEESINTILEMAEYKKTRKVKLIVMGCLSQRYEKELKESLPEVDYFITLDQYPKLPEIFAKIFKKKFYNDPERLFSVTGYSAYLKIAEGCYNRCSYCAIPLIRGNYVSAELDSLVSEAEGLVSKGTKELVLVAQDTTMYGIDLYHQKMLGTLVKKLDKIKGLKWIRILYLYPSEVDEQLLKELKSCKHFIPYFDLPLQYGNDKMLKAMNRKGKIKEFNRLVKLIKSYFPDAVLRTTMIVGFPGETEEDFKDLLKFIKKTKFDRLGAFTYSREQDTPAYSMQPQIKAALKKERLKELLEVQAKISTQKGKQYLGKTLEVLIEGIDEESGLFYGRSYLSAPDEVDGIVRVKTNKIHGFGDFVRVKITGSDVYDLEGIEA